MHPKQIIEIFKVSEHYFKSIIKVDLCRIQPQESFSSTTATFLHRAEVMRVPETQIPGRTQDTVNMPFFV